MNHSFSSCSDSHRHWPAPEEFPLLRSVWRGGSYPIVPATRSRPAATSAKERSRKSPRCRQQSSSAGENRLITPLAHPAISLHCSGLSQYNHHLGVADRLAIDSHYPLDKCDTIASGENLVIDFDFKSWLFKVCFALPLAFRSNTFINADSNLKPVSAISSI